MRELVVYKYADESNFAQDTVTVYVESEIMQ